MLKESDIDVITAQELLDEIAMKLDPLAFENPDIADREKRRKAVFQRLYVAYAEYRRRECGYDYNATSIQEADIPW